MRYCACYYITISRYPDIVVLTVCICLGDLVERSSRQKGAFSVYCLVCLGSLDSAQKGGFSMLNPPYLSILEF